MADLKHYYAMVGTENHTVTTPLLVSLSSVKFLTLFITLRFS